MGDRGLTATRSIFVEQRRPVSIVADGRSGANRNQIPQRPRQHNTVL